MAQDFDVVLIDASTAHRTDPDWVMAYKIIRRAAQAIAETQRFRTQAVIPQDFYLLYGLCEGRPLG